MTAKAQPRFSIALISAAVLGYEILLMALFSLIQWHHFAYLVVSVALLGFGASGSFLVLTRGAFAQRFRGFAVIQACLFGLGSLLCYALAQRLSFNPEELIWDSAHWLRLALVILLLALPFFFAANLVGLALMRFKAAQARVYAADLLGAGLGAGGMIALLFLLPPSAALRIVALLGFAAAAAVWIECGGRRRAAAVAMPLVVLCLYAMPGAWTEPLVSPYKSLSQLLRVPGTKVIAERHSPLGTISVVQSQTVPLRHAPGLSLNAVTEPPEQLALFTNGGGLSAITRYAGERAEIAWLDYLTSALPYHLQARARVLVLGAGGGGAILQALYHEAEHIDAVEINPQVVALLRGRFAEFSGRIYDRAGIDVHVDDARGFLRRTRARYDLIHFPVVDSSAAAAGVHGLDENYLFTVEALQLALARLDDGGYLVLTSAIQVPPRDSLKLFAGAIAALEARGAGDIERRLALIRGWQTGTLLVKKGELDATEIRSLKKFARERSFDLAWYPGMPRQEANRYNRFDAAYFYDAAQALLGAQRERFLRDYKFQLQPASDDRPFHSHFARWSSLPELVRLRHRGGGALLETGYLTLLITLALALLFSVLLILLPLAFLRRDRTPAAESPRMARVLGYFFALGLGFLLLEIAFLQKFILLLQHPVYAAAVVLASFLLAAGAGSAHAQRFAGRANSKRVAAIAVAIIVALGLAWLALLGPLLQFAGGWPLGARIALAIALIAPLGFCMGMPFPLGLSALAAGPPALTAWAWGINGCASVISAVLATLLAIHFGFDAVILLALCCYVVAAASFPRRAAG